MNRMFNCTFSCPHPGDLPLPAPRSGSEAALRGEIVRMIRECRVTRFFCVMELGVGLRCAEIILGLRRRLYPKLNLTCILPYEACAARWRSAERERLYNILAEADCVTTVSPHYRKGCHRDARRSALAEASYLIAVGGDLSARIRRTADIAQKRGTVVRRIPLGEEFPSEKEAAICTKLFAIA